MFETLVIASLVVLAMACRTSQWRVILKIGQLALFTATYLFGYWLLDSHVAGCMALFCWVLMPWVEIVGRVRKLRFPLQSVVKHRFPPGRDAFPELGEISSEVERHGFVEKDNTGWKWDDTDNFMRLFYHEEHKMQAAINLAQQSDYALSYVSLTTRTRDGCTFTTSNYPFSFTMKFAPQQRTNRHVGAMTFDDLLASHQAFLKRNSVAAEDLRDLDQENLPAYIEGDMSHQIAHNLSVGVLEATTDGMTRYSWRGCFFLWVQVVKDMILV
jgi:hypothetical protein